MVVVITPMRVPSDTKRQPNRSNVSRSVAATRVLGRLNAFSVSLIVFLDIPASVLSSAWVSASAFLAAWYNTAGNGRSSGKSVNGLSAGRLSNGTDWNSFISTT